MPSNHLNTTLHQSAKDLTRHRLRLPTGAWLFLWAGISLSLFTANPLLSCFALGVLPLLAHLTWRTGEPPVLFFALFFQWTQVSMAIFNANVAGHAIADYPNVSTTETAVWLSLTGLVVLSLGMRLGVGQRSRMLGNGAQENKLRYSQKRVWFTYLALFILAAVASNFAWQLPQFRTIILALLPLKWVAFFILAYLAFARKQGMRNRYLLLATGLEILYGFTGYFSGFKHVFFVLAIAFLTSKVRLKNKDILPVSGLILVVFFLSVCWTAIKPDYREFVNQGTGQQVVLVPVLTRLDAVVTMVADLSEERFFDGVDKLTSRLAYVEMFARVLNTVPHYLPHENGDLWLAAIKHVSMPRLLFPGKADLPSDSELTSKYTRVAWAGSEQGTSVSMGYMAESYIDFGMFGMFVPIFLCGLLWGWMYRYLMQKIPYRLVAYGMVSALLINANQFEMHTVKLLGGMIMNFIVFALVAKFVLPKYIHKLASRS